MAQPAADAVRAAQRLELFGCSIALLASVWALLDQGACSACEALTLLSGSPVLPVLGTLWYVALLILMLRQGIAPLSTVLICAGAGVHIALVGYMLLRGEPCMPCLSAAGGAFVMAGVALRLRVITALRSFGILALAAALTSLALAGVTSQSNFKLQRELQRVLVIGRASPAPASAKVQLHWFSREDCLRCAAFREEILPVLMAQYAEQLEITEHEAWSGIPAPTVLIRGRTETLLYPNPSLQSLQGVIEAELSSGQLRLP